MVFWEHRGLEMITAARLHFHGFICNPFCIRVTQWNPGPAVLTQGLAEPGCSETQSPPRSSFSVYTHFVSQRFPFIYIIFFLLLHLQKAVSSLQHCYAERPTLLWSLLVNVIHCPSHLEFHFGFILPKDG